MFTKLKVFSLLTNTFNQKSGLELKKEMLWGHTVRRATLRGNCMAKMSFQHYNNTDLT